MIENPSGINTSGKYIVLDGTQEPIEGISVGTQIDCGYVRGYVRELRLYSHLVRPIAAVLDERRNELRLFYPGHLTRYIVGGDK